MKRDDTSRETLADIVAEALDFFGGKAHYSAIYRYVAEMYPARCVSRAWQHSVQNVVESHCPQARNWKRSQSKPPWHLENVAKGTYRLVSHATPGINPTVGEPNPCRYERKAGTVEIDAMHRTVCLALIVEAERFLKIGLRSQYYKLHKDRFVDLQVLDIDSGVPILTFEVKSTAERYELYTAIGQVLLHGRAQKRDAGACIVRPHSSINFERPLMGLNIREVSWRTADSVIQFTGLDEVLADYAGSELPKKNRKQVASTTPI